LNVPQAPSLPQVADQSTPALVELPVAVNFCVLPGAMDAVVGVTAIDFGSATVSVVDPEMLPSAAVMLVLPAPTPVASPPAVVVATVVCVELHVTNGVRVCKLPFVRWPVATNCSSAPAAIEVVAGVTVMALRFVSLPVPLSAITIGLPKASSFIVTVPDL